MLRHAVGNVRGEATSLRNLANALSLTGDFESAARELERARSLHAGLDDREGLAAVESEIGLLAEERGLYPDALQAFRRALGEWQDLDDPLGVAQARNDIGFAQYQLGDYADARVYLQQAAADYATIGDAIGTVRSSQDLGLLAIASGHWSEARQRLPLLRQPVEHELPSLHERLAGGAPVSPTSSVSISASTGSTLAR